MNKKFKSLMICLIVAMCFMFTACDPADFFFDYDELKDKVVTVELINYDNPDVKTVKKKSDVLPFVFKKMEIVETLNMEQLDNFLQDLSKIHFQVCDDWTKYSSSASGLSLRVTYESGSFIVICCSNIKYHFVGTFAASGGVDEFMLRFPDPRDYVNLVNKYFTTQIS